MVEDFEPTPSERLMAYRKRSGKTQVQMAEELSVPLHLYGELERGVIAMDKALERLSAIELTLPEKLTAIRRRVGISQRIIAAELGVCRMTAAAMEEGRSDPTALIELLNKRSVGCRVTAGPQ